MVRSTVAFLLLCSLLFFQCRPVSTEHNVEALARTVGDVERGTRRARGGHHRTAKRSLTLTYVWGVLDEDEVAIFVRSFREHSPAENHDLVIVLEDDVVVSSKGSETLALGNVIIHRVNKSQRVASGKEPVLYRFFAWQNYLHTTLSNASSPNSQTQAGSLSSESAYALIAVTDMDVVFQRGYFDCFGADFLGLAAFSENPVPTIGKETLHVRWYQECEFKALLSGQTVKGSELLNQHGSFNRICAGFTLGDGLSLAKFLAHMVNAMSHSRCNDQGVQNILIYGDLLRDIPRVVVYNQYRGPVKLLDVGFISDAWGNAYNEDGQKYCVLHQYKAERGPSFAALLRGRYSYSSSYYSKAVAGRPLGKTLPRGRRVPMEDNRFPDGEHKSALTMHQHNLTAAGKLAITAPVPALKGFSGLAGADSGGREPRARQEDIWLVEKQFFGK